MNILYVKGPETTGVFRKVANARTLKECVEKIERNQPLNDDELHPILAACLFKVGRFLLSRLVQSIVSAAFPSDFTRTGFQLDSVRSLEKMSSLGESNGENSIRSNNVRRTRFLFDDRLESLFLVRILPTLSRANLILLKGLICLLYRISQRADLNGMNSFNLGLCISNSLFKTESTTISSGKQEADVMSSIVEFLIENCSTLFGSDVITCIPEKSIYQVEKATKASSMESLDEVDSSSPVALINRSHDSGLAASDPLFNDDSSELSEHIRRSTLPSLTIDWSSSISSGTGVVLSSIPLPRRRSSRLPHRPSKQFLEREKLSHDTTDDSDHPTPTKAKRTKSLSRRVEPSETKRTRSLKRTETLVKYVESVAKKRTFFFRLEDRPKINNNIWI